jgi:radical SAM protein with 4Fe4S-binding SPASM domain
MEYKISMAQIDPNGLCNSGCWFCPVAYSPNPEFAKKDMPIETLNNILSQLSEGKGKFVSESFDFVYTAHYNEVLLYKYFEEMLGLFRCYGLRTIILTNGTPLTRNKIDIIKKYPDVVYGICLNIPESDPALWSKATGKPESMFPKLINNVKYAIEQLPDMFKEKRMSIQVNGMNQFSLSQYGGWLDMLPNAPEINLDPEKGTLASSVKGFKELFPDLQIYEMPHLIDRAGHLDKQKVITNINGIKNHAKKDKLKVIGCGNGIEVGGRPNGWIHINANGDMFICCNDYDFETIFGNINEKTIDEIWMSKEHKDMIEKSYNSLCMTCAAAIWG